MMSILPGMKWRTPESGCTAMFHEWRGEMVELIVESSQSLHVQLSRRVERTLNAANVLGAVSLACWLLLIARRLRVLCV